MFKTSIYHTWVILFGFDGHIHTYIYVYVYVNLKKKLIFQ